MEVDQASALNPFLFAMVMERLTYEVKQAGISVDYVVSDDIVICSENRELVEENRERWRYALQRRGMKQLRW